MVRNLGVVTLPYPFPDQNAVVRGTTGKAAMLLDSYAEKAGLKILPDLLRLSLYFKQPTSH